MAQVAGEGVHELVATLQALVGVPPEAEGGGGAAGARRALPEDWRDDPVKGLVAMILADPTPPGVAIALAWFFGRGLPDTGGAPAWARTRDVDAAVWEALRAYIDGAGLEAARRQIAEAMGEP